MNDVVRRLVLECSEPYSIPSEEDRNFTVGWGSGTLSSRYSWNCFLDCIVNYSNEFNALNTS